MIQPPVLNYRSGSSTEPARRKRAVFLPLAEMSLALGSISVLGFLIFTGWPATWSAGMSIAALVMSIFSRTAVSADRTIRSCSMWLAGCGTLLFGAIGAIELLLQWCLK